MRSYPVFLNPAALRCLVVGVGKVGARKLHSLLRAGVNDILAVDPLLSPDDLPHEATGKKRKFEAADLEGRNLVFASTDNPDCNREIALLCSQRSIFCNVATSMDGGDFMVPSFSLLPEVEVAVSTNGASPVLAARIRHEIETRVIPPYLPLLRLMQRLRPHILSSEALTPEAKTALLRRLAHSPLLHLLHESQPARSAELLRSLLPAFLHPLIADYFHDYR